MLTPFFSFGRTDRSERTGTYGPNERAQIWPRWMEVDTTVDGGGHQMRTNILLVCHVQMVNVRIGLAGEAQDSTWTQSPCFNLEGKERP